MQQREHVILLQLLAPIEEVEFDYEGKPRYISAQRFGQLHGCRAGSTRGQQIVNDNHALSAADRVFVHLERVAAVLELVSDFSRFCRKLFRLAHRYESRIQPISQSGAEDKTARLDSQNEIDIFLHVVGGE